MSQELDEQAVAALVAASTSRSLPITRKLRLFEEAHRRFATRLSGAAKRVGLYKHQVVAVLPLHQAA